MAVTRHSDAVAPLRSTGPVSGWLGRHGRTASASFGRLVRQPFASLMIILVIAVTLAIPAALNLAIKNFTAISSGWDDALDFSVFLDTGVSAGDDRTLWIPAGCTVDWYLDPPTGSELALPGTQLVGGADLALEVTLRRDRHADVPLASVRRTQGLLRLELPQGEGPLALRFEAATDGAAEPGRRIAIEGPRVEAPPRSAHQTTHPKLVETGAGSRRPNVILYLVDALRAGGHRPAECARGDGAVEAALDRAEIVGPGDDALAGVPAAGVLSVITLLFAVAQIPMLLLYLPVVAYYFSVAEPTAANFTEPNRRASPPRSFSRRKK